MLKRKKRKKFCPKCGAELKQTDKYCTICGYSFKKRKKKIDIKRVIIVIIILLILWTAIRLLTGKNPIPQPLIDIFINKTLG